MFSPGGMQLIQDLIPHASLKHHVSNFLNAQMEKYKAEPTLADSQPPDDDESTQWVHAIGWLWNALIVVMLAWFVLKAVESFANQQYEKEQLEHNKDKTS